MTIEIRHRTSDVVLHSLDRAALSGADLRGADLSEANLRWADLRWSNLSGTDLNRADLSGADLREADLSGAYLNSRGALEAGHIVHRLTAAGACTEAILWAAQFPADADVPTILTLCRADWRVWYRENVK